MEDLFRFILTRPAQRADEKRTVEVHLSADYYGQLKQARESGESRTILRGVALAQRHSAQALKSLDELQHAAPLNDLLKALVNRPDMPLDELGAMIASLFGSTANEVVVDPGFVRDRERLSDVLVTNVILGNDGLVSSDDAARLLRATALVERTAAVDAELAAIGGIGEALERTLLLPGDLFPLASERGALPPPPAGPSIEEKNRHHAALIVRRDNLLATYTMLTRIAPEHLALPEEPAAPELSTEAALPPARRATTRRGESPPSSVAGMVAATVRVGGAPLLLKPEVTAAFGAREREVLAERKLDLTRVSLPAAVDRLSVELQAVELELAELGAATHLNVIRVGTSFLLEDATGVGGLVAGSLSVPDTHGTVAPAGVGDLLVVKQFLKRYEARELAHIENILKGEYKERMHRRALTTEETFTSETEMKREEERDQQSTERFELKTESSQVQKEDASLKIGLAVTGKYGPAVEFKATTDFALNQSKEEATKIATSYSKDVTSRATSKIFERRREERILKTTQVFEEKNTHGVDNKAGADHVIGQYQWVDKVYEAQVFNYGKRLLFDLMLPEPAAFLLYALGNQPKAGVALVKPVPFTLKPTDISQGNYAYYVKQYEVLGVEPPPQPYITISKVVEGEGAKHGSTKTLEIPIKDGYQAFKVSVRQSFIGMDSKAFIDVIVGEWIHRFTLTDGWAWSYHLSNEVGSVPVAVITDNVHVFAQAFEIDCQLTPRALDEWKLKTHAAILQAYQKQLRDYEEKLAALEVQAAQQVLGRNPLENEQLIRTELKKGAISVFTAQHYDLFGAISLSPLGGYPQPGLAEADAEGRYIRFFEQAFEWEQMMFFYYPYFWGRKPNWVKRALLQDVDPLFAEFIKAGAARVVVSVRPGFEQVINHFLNSGETWDGGDLPPITSPLYLSIIEEIKERDKAVGAEVPQGDPWDVHLPTTLLKIRDQATLPEWQKNDQGEWIPV